MTTIPLHTRFRRNLRKALNRILVTLLGSKMNTQSIDHQTIKKVLIIRMNYRIGNILFITPLLNALNTRMPQAKVDVLIGSKSPASLLKGLDNVEDVYDMPRKLLLHPIDFIKFIVHMRSQAYDLVINLNSTSTSDRLATVLAKGTYKLGFHSPDLWLPLTHTVADSPEKVHAGVKPLKLMEAFSQQDMTYAHRLDINLKADEKAEAATVVRELLSTHGIDRTNRRVIAIFRNARHDKKIADSWWRQWYDALVAQEPDVAVVDILSPDVPEPLNERVLSYGNKNLRQLCAVFSQLDAFVSADTGPMHLACASGVVTIAFFNATNPVVFGPLGEENLTLDFNLLTPETAAKEVLAHLNSL